MMSDITTCLNDLSYIPPNNEQNEPTQGDIDETSNEPTQAIRNELEELYAIANEELYPGCDYVIRLDFMFSHIAKEMTWHATGKCTEPGKMQHPVDGRAWKNFDTKYLDFEKEPSNVRLGLDADGFNPFGNLSQSYNMWPMILTTYNLPSWLCMKESSFMLTLLIPGPKSPGKDIDVYLRLLIDDLKDLWAKPGVKTIDVATRLKFNMRATVVWTINDFPARSSLSGWSGQGLKSYDCHLMMQRVLPYGLQQYLPANVAKPITKLCLFFNQICSQTLMEDYMLKAQNKVVDILCNLKLKYPPGFFDIMIYLVIHLPLEALEGGPIRPRWMYPFERFMKKLKNYVQNKAKPEGSIVEGYVAEEALTSSSLYFRDVTTKFKRPDRNVDCPPPTCQFQIRQCHVDKDPGVSASSELFALACGPTSTPISVNSCVFNGVRVVAHSRDEHRTTQNSGICSPGEDGEMYYGQLKKILEFFYMSFKTVLFLVKWFDTSNKRRVKHLVIRNNITQILANGESFKNDQYILATQVKQCFYLEDMSRRPLGWKVVEHVNHKKFSNEGVIMVEDDPDIILVDKSSDLALTTSLNDLEIAALHIDGQSIDVDTPPDIIEVDEDDDVIDDEGVLPHDLADSDDEDLVSIDDDDGVGVVYSSEEED
ncbi:reverse transcriptase domain-containing protein [Tanacetum coccineum]|uniref:Reverse transcriptase domain-containing protein n=1 Tax=Tanacetum coccineum TaxID=301880 RepID=A0ABQ5ASV5_9ASTR